MLDLSASLNPVAPDPGEVVGKHLDALGRYPDPGSATAALAAAMGVDPDRLLLTNGGRGGHRPGRRRRLGGHASTSPTSASTARPGGKRPVARLQGPGRGYNRARPAPEATAGPAVAVQPAQPDRPPDGARAAGVWDEAFYPLATGRWTRGTRTAARSSSGP